MNILKKIYCRTFQCVLHSLLPVLPYREPEILSSVSEIPHVLTKLGISRVLLVTDNYLSESGITDPLQDALSSSGILCAVYDETCPNPTTENVEAAKRMYIDSDCGAIIAFGGGSSMDCAKAAGAMIARPHTSIDHLKGTLHVLRRIPTLIAIPATAGTGSEVTLAAVITDRNTHHKYTINDFVLIPDYAVHDPEITYTLPSCLTATTGMDALTHAVEAYIGRSTSSETREKALQATSLIFGNIEKAYAHPENRTAKSNMLKAAYLAGVAFTKSYVGYVHAVSHSLSGRYNVPHGLANSVLLPIILEDYGPCVYRKLHEMAVAAKISSPDDSDKAGAEKFIDSIKELNRKMGIPAKLSGIKEEDIPQMAKYASKEGNPLYPVPRLMDARELEKYYRMVSDDTLQ